MGYEVKIASPAWQTYTEYREDKDIETPETLDFMLTADRIIFFSAEKRKKNFTKEEVLRRLCKVVAQGWKTLSVETLTELVTRREADLPTRLSPLIALPHAVVPSEGETRLAAAVVPEGLEWDSDRENPVRLVMLLVGGQENHLKVLSELALRLRDDPFMLRLVGSAGPEEFLAAFSRKEAAFRGPRYHRGRDVSALVFDEAVRLSEALGSAKLVLHADAVGDGQYLRDLAAGMDVLIVTTREGILSDPLPDTVTPVFIPFKGDRCAPDVRFSLLYLLGLGILRQDDMVVNVYGKPDSGYLDSIRLVDIGDELDVHALGGGFGGLPKDVDLSIFNRVLHIALELAAEGREGKPVGTIFVVGDWEGVSRHITQMIANPFHGYPAQDRNILDPGMEETIKEYAKIDGAFIIRRDGTLEAAGAYLSGRPAAEEMHSGLGARHAAAQGITALSAAMAVVLSESTRKVTVFRGGRKVMEL